MDTRLSTAVRRTATALAVFAAGPCVRRGLVRRKILRPIQRRAGRSTAALLTQQQISFFDYSTVGISSAPSALGTRGLKLQANQSSGVFGGVSVSPEWPKLYWQLQRAVRLVGEFQRAISGRRKRIHSVVHFWRGNERHPVAQWAGGTQDSIWFGGHDRWQFVERLASLLTHRSDQILGHSGWHLCGGCLCGQQQRCGSLLRRLW